MNKKLLCVFRLFLWICSGLGHFNKTLSFRGGWDTLHPFAPYSFGGINRAKFEESLKENCTQRLSMTDVLIAKYGVKSTNDITRDMHSKNFERKSYIYRYFLSPWLKDYNYNR